MSPKLFDVPVELEKSEEEARLTNPQSIWNGTVCVPADVFVWSSVSCGYESKDRDHLPVPIEIAAVNVPEAEALVNVVGRSIAVHCALESGGFIFRQSVSHACLRDSLARFLIFLAIPCVTFVSSHVDSEFFVRIDSEIDQCLFLF